VVIVNRRFAELYMAGRRVVGQSITLGSASRTVIGVAPDLLMGSMDQPGVNGPGLYVPLAQTQGVSMQLMARTTGDPMSIVSSMRAAVESLDPNLALMDVGRVDRLIAREAGSFQVIGAIFLVSGLIALFLAAIGLYGVMAFTMRQRTLEWGIRMALGATRGNVVGSAMREGSRQLAIGLGIGIVTAGMLSTPLSRFFYQVQPWDPAVFSLIVLILGVTSLVAILVPAHRASRSDPMAVLRQE
jgi:ABC-type antimicrobial peptide transport system permease subunit